MKIVAFRCVPCNVWWEVQWNSARSMPQRMMTCPIYLGEPPLERCSELCRMARGGCVKDHEI